jgi:hypothetical protein
MTQDSEQRYRDESKRRFERIKSQTRYSRNVILCATPGVALGIVLLAVTPVLGVIVGVIGGIGGAALYHWWLWSKATAEAEQTVMSSWAAERGWTYEREPAALDDVAFCRNREKPVFRHGFDGPMAGLPGRIVNFTYSTYETRTVTAADGSTTTRREEVKHKHTVLRLELGDLGLTTLQLSPQGLGGGMFEKLRSTFTGSRNVNLESSEFNRRFTLLVDDTADDLMVRRVFEPAFIVRCVEGRFPMATFQYQRPALAFIWGDQYDVTELEEVEHRIADAAPMAEALTVIRQRLAAELNRP